jgi:hypothetical protein
VLFTGSEHVQQVFLLLSHAPLNEPGDSACAFCTLHAPSPQLHYMCFTNLLSLLGFLGARVALSFWLTHMAGLGGFPWFDSAAWLASPGEQDSGHQDAYGSYLRIVGVATSASYQEP